MSGKKSVTFVDAALNDKYVNNRRTLPLGAGAVEIDKFTSMDKDAPLLELVQELGLEWKEDQSAAARSLLIDHINYLVKNDFQQLISMLYRMDVNESKLRSVLKQNPGTDAGMIIADLMIERQARKIKSRQQYRRRDNNIDENEKW